MTQGGLGIAGLGVAPLYTLSQCSRSCAESSGAPIPCPNPPRTHLDLNLYKICQKKLDYLCIYFSHLL